ncbi:MAG TPA: small multi-drug export protein [Candidatus Andersenbacteria bacterium]|nr:small multi-drug export protein [Candidatus Andersenbacteria bacterium]
MSLALTIAQKLASLPPELATYLLAMIPVGELRGSIPIGIAFFKLPVYEALILAILGTMTPIYFILWLLEDVSAWLRKHNAVAEQFFAWLFQHTRAKMHGHVTKYGLLAIGIIAAIPIPILGGAWTAALAAFVFGFEKKKSFWVIFAGTIVAGLIVLALTEGGLLAVKTIG